MLTSSEYTFLFSCHTLFSYAAVVRLLFTSHVQNLDVSLVFYAVWKSRSSPSARGRLSIQVSLEEFNDITLEKPTCGRIWWENLTKPKLSNPAPASGLSRPHQWPGNKEGSAARWRKPHGSGLPHFFRNASDPILEQPLNPAGNTSSNRRRPPSFSRLIPRMELFHKVMKDEVRSLIYQLVASSYEIISSAIQLQSP